MSNENKLKDVEIHYGLTNVIHGGYNLSVWSTLYVGISLYNYEVIRTAYL